MSSNNSLHRSKKAKNDEFYTIISDIEKELKNYKDFFNCKVVYCNCDDYRWSNFVKYFKDNFEDLGLKKLIATNYDIGDGSWKYEYDGEKETIAKLEGNGSFDSEECVKLLNESDVVVSNPPFSCFISYLKQLMDYNKKFLIIGNMNAITYKEIFPYIKNNELWFGVSIHSGDREFKVPDNYPLEAAGYRVDEEGNKYIRVKGVRWFTNISNENRNKPLDLYKKYNPKEYPKYDNYDAIEVSKTCEIPEDYDGVMGVPISYFDKHCTTQFEIVGMSRHNDLGMDGGYWQGGKADATINGKGVYPRLLIKKIRKKV